MQLHDIHLIRTFIAAINSQYCSNCSADRFQTVARMSRTSRIPDECSPRPRVLFSRSQAYKIIFWRIEYRN